MSRPSKRPFVPDDWVRIFKVDGHDVLVYREWADEDDGAAYIIRVCCSFEGGRADIVYGYDDDKARWEAAWPTVTQESITGAFRTLEKQARAMYIRAPKKGPKARAPKP